VHAGSRKVFSGDKLRHASSLRFQKLSFKVLHDLFSSSTAHAFVIVTLKSNP
jgi:hypothetical protein